MLRYLFFLLSFSPMSKVFGQTSLAHTKTFASDKTSIHYVDLLTGRYCDEVSDKRIRAAKSVPKHIEGYMEDKVMVLSDDIPPSLKAAFQLSIEKKEQWIGESRAEMLSLPAEIATDTWKRKKGRFPSVGEVKRGAKSLVEETKSWSDHIKNEQARLKTFKEGNLSPRNIFWMAQFQVSSLEVSKNVGYELKLVDGGLVELHLVWPDKDGTPKRVFTEPLLIFDQAAVRADYFDDLKKGLGADMDPFSLDTLDESKKDLSLMNHRVVVKEPSYFIFSNELVTKKESGEVYFDQHLELRDIFSNMDLGCFMRLYDKIRKRQKELGLNYNQTPPEFLKK